MKALEKPIVSIPEIEAVLSNHFGSKVVEIMELGGGNLSSVFSFSHEGKSYIIKFSDMKEAYETDSYVSELLNSQGIPFPRSIGKGQSGKLRYLILEKITGINFADCSLEQQRNQLPELIHILTQMNHIDLGSTTGFGWIGPTGDGTSPSWKDLLIATFAEDQTGTFWEGWTGMFETTFLEKDVFDECYNRLMSYAAFNESHRNFIHGDFHQWNIISDGKRITGIIDGNFAYGDFLVDLATFDRHMNWMDVVTVYQEYQEQAGIIIPNFKERLIGAYYFKGLDGLRFFARMGWKDAYHDYRQFLLSLIN